MTTSERLTKAKELLVRDGWMVGMLRGNLIDPTDMRRCALGALYDVDGLVDYRRLVFHPEHLMVNQKAIRYLLMAVSIKGAGADAVADYNNKQSDVNAVLAWFDRAIELAQAAEMYRELESKPLEQQVEAEQPAYSIVT